MQEAVDHVARHQISAHEAVCAERYNNLEGRLSSIDGRLTAASNRFFAIMLGIAGTAVMCLLGIAAYIGNHVIANGVVK